MLDLYQKNKLFFLILIAGALGFLVWYFSGIVIFIIVAGVISIVFAPLIQRKSVNVHPVEIFFVVIAAASLGGIACMIVAVPTYGFVKIIAHEFLSNFRIV